jgi:hypothetical protein
MGEEYQEAACELSTGGFSFCPVNRVDLFLELDNPRHEAIIGAKEIGANDERRRFPV